MREAEDMNPPDVDVPGILLGLKPAAPAAIVARSIWYQSGYQAGRRRLNLWRGATVSLLLGMSALLGLKPATNRTANPNQIIVVKVPVPPVQAPTVQAPTETPLSGAGSYVRLLNALTHDGPRPWAEHDLPIGNPHATPSRHPADAPEMNLYRINERG